MLVKNYGTITATNVSGNLVCSSSYITINDNYGYWGSIAPSDSVENTGDPFNVTLSSSCPMGTVLDFTLPITADGGYANTLDFSIVVGELGNDYVTHDCGNVMFSLTRYGALGYMSAFAPNPGDGFTYPIASASHLFYGTFAAANAETYCVDRFFKGGTCDDDWHTTGIPDGTIRMYEPGPENFDEYTTARYDDSGHPSAKGLVIEQTSWAWDDATANDFVITVFNIHNDGGTTINDLYAALFMDWDVGVSTSNQGSSEAARNLTWIYQNTPYVGVAILDPPRTTPAANLALVSHQNYVYPLNGLPDSIMMRFMDGTIQQPSTDIIYDWSACNSAGPFTLNQSDTVVVAFAVLGGDNLSNLQENADTAYNRYWGIIGVEETKITTIPAINIHPAISFGQKFSLAYRFTVEIPLQLKIYNTLGQLVEEKDYGLRNGTGEIAFDLKALSQGVYFAKVEAGNTTKTTKIIWLK